MENQSSYSGKVYVEAAEGCCNRRLLDTKKVSYFFEKNGYEIVNNSNKSDIALLVTCAVSKKREDSSIRRVVNLKKSKNELIVCGCLPAINKLRLNAVHEGGKISTSELSALDKIFPNMRFPFNKMEDANSYYSPFSNVYSFHFLQRVGSKFLYLTKLPIRYLLKKEIPGLVKKVISINKMNSIFPIRISWGCNCKCSYCSIRFAIGAFHSKSIETCVNEFTKGLNQGFKSFEIIADNVGAYGIDIGKTFPDLLNALFSIDKEYKVLIWNLSPEWFIKYKTDFIPIFKKNKIDKIHYPIQSGSSKILKAMRRYSNTDKIKESIDFMREYVPNLIITTDIIIGFPGETDDDINQTIDLLNSVQFNSVNIFKYYDAPMSLASRFNEKVEPGIMMKRINRILRVLDKQDIVVGIS